MLPNIGIAYMKFCCVLVSIVLLKCWHICIHLFFITVPATGKGERDKTNTQGGGGVTFYILVYTDVPLDWVGFLSCQIYDWGGKFALGYVNGRLLVKKIIY